MSEKTIIEITEENAEQVASMLNEKFSDKRKGCRFAGITYLSEGKAYLVPELAKFQLALHVDKMRLVRESLAKLQSMEVSDEIEAQAKVELIDSLSETLEKGVGNNSSYTRKGTYETEKGVRKNSNGNLEINCLQLSRKVVKQGELKKVNSRPLTVAKNKLRKELPYSQLRSFTLSIRKFKRVAIEGEQVELE